MQVILDTTEFYSDLRMRGTAFRFLESYIIRHPATLIVPRIVREEVINHYRESLPKAFQRAETAIRNLQGLAPESFRSPPLRLDVDAAVEGFCAYISQRLQQLQAGQPSYDGVSVASLVERALQRRKPFDSEGKVGFRDALVWEALIEIAQQTTGDVVLVTRNKKDFGSHGLLATDLADELGTRGIDPDRVVVCEGLDRFVEEYIKPSLETLDSIHEQIADGTFEGFNARQFFADEHSDIRSAVDTQVRISDFAGITEECLGKYDDPELGEFESEPTSIEVVDVWGLENGEVAVGIDFTVDGTVRCMEQTESYWGEDDVEDFEGDVEFVLHMTVILNRDSGEVTNWEINDLDMALTRGWPFPDYG